MSPELKTKVMLIKLIEEKINNWQDDLGYQYVNKDCAKDIAKKIFEEFEITPLTKEK